MYNYNQYQNYPRPYQQPMQPVQPVQQPWPTQPMAQNAPEFQPVPQSGQELAQAIHRLCDILERKAVNDG